MVSPRLMRRTLDWLSISLLKGMSREALRVIFCLAVAMVITPRRAAETLSTSKPVTKSGAALSL